MMVSRTLHRTRQAFLKPTVLRSQVKQANHLYRACFTREIVLSPTTWLFQSFYNLHFLGDGTIDGSLLKLDLFYVSNVNGVLLTINTASSVTSGLSVYTKVTKDSILTASKYTHYNIIVLNTTMLIAMIPNARSCSQFPTSCYSLRV